MLQLFTHHVVSINLLSRTPTRDAGYLRPQRRYRPAAAITPSRHNKLNGSAKRTVSLYWELIFLLCFSLTPLSNYIAVTYPKSRRGISQPTEEIQPCRRRHILATQYTKGFCKKNGEFLLRIDFFTVFFTHHCFELNCCHVPQLATPNISAHREVNITPLLPLPRITIH